ncbi:MAG: hypothetical protein ACOY8P_12350 [Thermodesulfobacteriota bacterium]
MIRLLADLPQPGYPADYLLARLPARRPRWREAPTAGGEGWPVLARESRWLYGQLPQRLRRELAPLFLYFELRPLFLFLRGLAAGRCAPADELLAATLLADDLKRTLLRAREAGEALRVLASWWPGGAGLERLAAAKGLAAVEQVMTGALFREAARSATVLRPLWAALIDLENVVALAKRLRWQVASPFGYRPGGFTAQRRFLGAEQNRVPEMAALVVAPLRAAAQQGNWSLEGVLVGRVERQLGTAATTAPAATVAAYLWGAYAATRRLALAQAAEASQ